MDTAYAFMRIYWQCMPEIPQLKAEFFKALGTPRSDTVLELLGEGPKTVSALLEFVDTSQPQLSRHLAQLRIAGLVMAHRAGPMVVYSIADERISEVLQLSREMLLDTATASPRRAAAILDRRALAALLPSSRDYRGLRTGWRADVLAGVTVAVVALPLALGFGVASGLGAEAGLITAIIAGVVAGIFGGSNVQVSGPTGAMTVVLVPVVASVGPSGVVIVALLAGVLLILAGAARLGATPGCSPGR